MISLFFLQLFLGLLVLLWLLEKTDNKKKAFDIFTLLIAIFGFTRILSIIFSLYPASSVQSLYKEALFYLGFLAMSFYLKAMNKENIEKITFTFTISSIAAAITGLILFNLKLVDRAQSFSSGYATFSSYLITAAGVYIALQFCDRKQINWVLWAAGLSIIFSAIITSLGRTNIIIAALLFIAGLIFHKIKIKQAIIIIFLTALISFLSFQNNSSSLSQRVENPTGLSDRNIIWKGFETLKLQHPFLGFGPRTFHDIFPYVNELGDKKIGSWHNDFIQMYFESGTLGLITFTILILITIYFPIVYLRKPGLIKSNCNILLGILLGTLALVLSSLTAGFISSPVLSIVFALLISLLSAVTYYTNLKRI
ncbi:MAG: O-antigen ligase family protein [Ignavibacteriaceae bacterium]